MSKTPQEATVDNHFVGKDSAIRRTYDQLLTELRKLGGYNRRSTSAVGSAEPG